MTFDDVTLANAMEVGTPRARQAVESDFMRLSAATAYEHSGGGHVVHVVLIYPSAIYAELVAVPVVY